jgi:hypothetical protein
MSTAENLPFILHSLIPAQRQHAEKRVPTTNPTIIPIIPRLPAPYVHMACVQNFGRFRTIEGHHIHFFCAAGPTLRSEIENRVSGIKQRFANRQSPIDSKIRARLILIL